MDLEINLPFEKSLDSQYSSPSKPVQLPLPENVSTAAEFIKTITNMYMLCCDNKLGPGSEFAVVDLNKGFSFISYNKAHLILFRMHQAIDELTLHSRLNKFSMALMTIGGIAISLIDKKILDHPISIITVGALIGSSLYCLVKYMQLDSLRISAGRFCFDIEEKFPVFKNHKPYFSPLEPENQ